MSVSSGSPWPEIPEPTSRPHAIKQHEILIYFWPEAREQSMLPDLLLFLEYWTGKARNREPFISTSHRTHGRSFGSCHLIVCRPIHNILQEIKGVAALRSRFSGGFTFMFRAA
jgi:hypothetical protein